MFGIRRWSGGLGRLPVHAYLERTQPTRTRTCSRPLPHARYPTTPSVTPTVTPTSRPLRSPHTAPIVPAVQAASVLYQPSPSLTRSPLCTALPRLARPSLLCQYRPSVMHAVTPVLGSVCQSHSI